MQQSGRRSGNARYGSVCPARMGRPGLGHVSHRQSGVATFSLVDAEPERSVMALRLQLARALGQFLRATDYREACRAVVQHPILLVDSASELLRAAIEEAEQRGDEADKETLLRYLKVLELARETREIGLGSDADQPDC